MLWFGYIDIHGSAGHGFECIRGELTRGDGGEGVVESKAPCGVLLALWSGCLTQWGEATEWCANRHCVVGWIGNAYC